MGEDCTGQQQSKAQVLFQKALLVCYVRLYRRVMGGAGQGAQVFSSHLQPVVASVYLVPLRNGWWRTSCSLLAWREEEQARVRIRS